MRRSIRWPPSRASRTDGSSATRVSSRAWRPCAARPRPSRRQRVRLSIRTNCTTGLSSSHAGPPRTAAACSKTSTATDGRKSIRSPGPSSGPRHGTESLCHSIGLFWRWSARGNRRDGRHRTGTSAPKLYKRLFNSPPRRPPVCAPRSGAERVGGMTLAKIKIQNVVASTSLREQLDLQAIALALGGAEYEPEQFPGLIYRLKEPKTATLLFRSGKVVCTGAKSLEHVKTAIDMVAKQIEAAGIPIKKNPVIEVQNIVASSDLGTEINLNAIAISLGLEKVEYEPEQFPGLVYRIDVPKVVVLLFGSGKLVCTGARKPSDVEEAVEKITQELKAAGLLR